MEQSQVRDWLAKRQRQLPIRRLSTSERGHVGQYHAAALESAASREKTGIYQMGKTGLKNERTNNIGNA